MAEERNPLDADFSTDFLDLDDLSEAQKLKMAMGLIKRMAPALKVLAKDKVDQERARKLYEKIGYAIGAFVIGASGTLLAYVVNLIWPGHKGP